MFDLNKTKLTIAFLVGLLIFTACDEDTKKTGNETLLPTATKSEDVIDIEDVINLNEKEEKELTPDEIEALLNENANHFMDYIFKNLGIESWYGNIIYFEKSRINLNDSKEQYTVLSLRDGFYLRLLIFKEDKFIDYIDFGGWNAGTEYRIEKAEDKVFVVGNSCRGYGAGIGRYFEDWYLLNEQGKKLVVSFPYRINEHLESFAGYNLDATSIKFNPKEDIGITVEYSIIKDYFMDDVNYYMNTEGYEQITVEGTKKVVFKWDDEKTAFVSDYAVDDMGVTEIPPESMEITDKCTDILKKNYQKFNQMALAVNEVRDIDKMNQLWKYFLADCKDCDEKVALLEILSIKDDKD